MDRRGFLGTLGLLAAPLVAEGQSGGESLSVRAPGERTGA